MALREDTLVMCSLAPEPSRSADFWSGGAGRGVTTLPVFCETWFHLYVEGEAGNQALALMESIHL